MKTAVEKLRVIAFFFVSLSASLTLVGPMQSLWSAHAQTNGWSRPVNISNRLGRSRFPDVAVDAMGNVHVVWSDDFEGDRLQWGEGIFHTMWKGTSWTQPMDILVTLGQWRKEAHIPAIAADLRGNVHIVWTDTYQLYYSHAAAGDAWRATSWSAPQVLSGLGRTYFSDVAVDGAGNIHVAWEETLDPMLMEEIDIYYRRSTDGGVSWSEPVNVSLCPQVSCRRPAMTVDHRGGLHIVWGAHAHETLEQDTTNDVYYGASSDGGDSWSDPVNVSDSADLSGLPSVIVGGDDQVHVVWQEGTDRTARLYHRAWDGLAWSALTEIFRSDQSYWWMAWPSAAVDSAGNIHVVWSTAGGNRDQAFGSIQHSFSTDGGQSWTKPVSIPGSEWLGLTSWTPRPEMVVSLGNQIHAIWYDGTAEDEYEIFYSHTQSDAPPQTPVSLPATPTPILATMSPSTIPGPSTATSPSPSLEVEWTPTVSTTLALVASLPKSGSLNQSATRPLIATLVPVVAFLSLVLLAAALRRRRL